MTKSVAGTITKLNGQQFYKIENYDHMEDFFMTITSSSDVWNFCWSKGGITAGRINADHAIFPYYTADKVSDSKLVTGSYTVLSVEKDGKKTIWEPFAPLLSNTGYKYSEQNIQRNIYKNANGTKIWFEEINNDLELVFRYGWTSSAKYGLVKMSYIENISNSTQKITVLDGCRNILPACIDSALQVSSSELLDAYKQTDLDEKSNLAMFRLSSVLTDKAEPSEALLANVSWFSTEDKIFLSNDPVEAFYKADCDIKKLNYSNILRGGRASCFIAREISLDSKATDTWFQVFDTFLNASRIAILNKELADKSSLAKSLNDDINATDDLMTTYLTETDGIQNTASDITCIHHRANVMFNIMRGGFFADNGKINIPDLIKFIGSRNTEKLAAAKEALKDILDSNSVSKDEVLEKITASGDKQLMRLYLEYLPMIFSRRHGDPSRPWNRFNIKLNDEKGNPILNYEGNWRDIFQNWEALGMSYPSYIKNMCAKFLNAMTADGFNPYRISRDGIDWEVPEPDNPWAQYGYWGDHQVIYLTKLLELWDKTDRAALLNSLNECIYSSSNIPYHIKSYEEILDNPGNSIKFDQELSDKLIKLSKEFGTDKKLIQDENGQPYLTSLTSKIIQIIIAKAANLIPGGGIWMNTQRPEWNDANNALAGWGLSVVTLCYLNRMLSFLIKTYKDTDVSAFTLPQVQFDCFSKLTDLYKNTNWDKAIANDTERKNFADKAGLLFETERNFFYANGFNCPSASISKEDFINSLEAIKDAVCKTISVNKKDNGLYHTYNTMIVKDKTIKIEYLQEMLEGQVAVLSSELLTSQEALDLTKALRNSDLYEERQKSYTLYPNKELPAFQNKNNITEADIKGLENYIAKSGSAVLEKDINGIYHFNNKFNNARIMQEVLINSSELKPSAEEMDLLLALYEKTFNHQSFTGRSGTFYAYEGLGSIYWHMVSKLLLAVQENTFQAIKNGDSCAKDLEKAYYDVRAGLSFNKTPEIYGAFPSDPYSHTPKNKGAKQPGMTGQVKEEVLTRWGELGVFIENGKAIFNPLILKKEEFFEDGTLDFTWCNTKVKYILSDKKTIEIEYASGEKVSKETMELTEEETKVLFSRTGKISNITVGVKL